MSITKPRIFGHEISPKSLQWYTSKVATIAKARSPFSEYAGSKVAGASSAEQARMHYDPSEPIITSVIIPVYDTAPYLRTCLDSVLGQTQTQIEVLLVDDGSTDESLSIEHEYARRDPRVHVITQPNLCQGTARNRGLACARGEFVYFMDSDDAIVDNLLETCHAACMQDSLDFAMFDTVGFKGSPSDLRPDLFQEVQRRGGVSREDVCDGVTFWNENFPEGRLLYVCWLQYFRKSFLLDNGLQFKEGIYFEDNDWAVRIYLAAKRIRLIPHALHRYRARPGSNVKSGFTKVLAESCPNVHRTLCEIGHEETERERINLIDGAQYVLGLRLLELAKLTPDDELQASMRSFADELCRLIESESEPPTLRRWHRQTLAKLCEDVQDWPNFDTVDIRRRFLDTAHEH